jgi:uncharacterized protein (TIGR00661 family)
MSKPKLLYAIQGTGNGHVARAREIVPILQERYEVEILLSGNQSEVRLPFPIHHQRKGLVMHYSKKGGVSFVKTWLKTNIIQLIWEVLRFPVHQYDVVLNDFEFVSAWACKLKGKECLAAGHQAAFRSGKVPLPEKKDVLGQFILRYYAPATHYLGYHFERYDDFIQTPVIRKEIRTLEVQSKPHYTVYLPAYADDKLQAILEKIPEIQWEVFSKRCKQAYQTENCQFRPVENEAFLQSFAHCTGVLTSAGFETPAEALYLGKKLFVVPIKHQYEQYCNAAALKALGIPVSMRLDSEGQEMLRQWCNEALPLKVQYADTTAGDLYQFIEAHLPQAKAVSVTNTI